MSEVPPHPAQPSRRQPAPPAGEHRGDRVLWALALTAFAVRAGLLLLEPRQCGLAGDESGWVALGTQELGRPRRGLSPFRNHLLFYPPLYPYFIAVLHRALGSLAAVLSVQALVGSLLVPAVGRVGRMVFGPAAGLAAAAMVAFYPDFVWFSVHFWSETLFIVLLWWAIERLLSSGATEATGASAFAGILWGLATLTRELALYLAPFALLWLARGGARRGRPALAASPAVRRAGAFMLGLVLTIAPWTIRNAIVFHAFIPVSTMGGSNLWQGNVPLTHLEVHETLSKIEGPVERDRHARELAWQTIRQRQPLWIFEKLSEQMPEFWKAGSEILDHLVGREACGPLRASSQMTLEVVVLAPYLVLLVACLVGLARARPGPGVALLLALLLAYNLAHVVAYATTRFRLPVLPIVFLFAAAALMGREPVVAPLRGWRLGALVVLGLLALWMIRPGLDELLLWRDLTGQPLSG